MSDIGMERALAIFEIEWARRPLLLSHTRRKRARNGRLCLVHGNNNELFGLTVAGPNSRMDARVPEIRAAPIATISC